VIALQQIEVTTKSRARVTPRTALKTYLYGHCNASGTSQQRETAGQKQRAAHDSSQEPNHISGLVPVFPGSELVVDRASAVAIDASGSSQVAVSPCVPVQSASSKNVERRSFVS
jgi:hypothetical protein